MDRTAAIAVIGDEILSGKYADENARHAITELFALGVRLRRIVVIPDEEDEIGATVRDLATRFDVVLTSGGVGPTHDDRTIAGIARGFGVPVVHHPRLIDLLEGFYGSPLGAGHLRLAEVPRGSDLFEVPGSPAPVLYLENVYILPGVPSLFRQKLALLRDRLRAAPFFIARLFLDVDETEIAQRLADAARDHAGIAFGSYPRFDDPVPHLVLTVEGKDRAALERAVTALCATLGGLVRRVEGP